MRTYKFWNNLVGWLVWVVATMVFVGTAERAASWWDCGEYISSASKLMVGHPPGAPTFQLFGCLFSLLAFGDPTKIGFMVNVMSALCSSFTILFLFWSITMLAKKLVYRFMQDAPEYDTWTPDWAQSVLILASGVVGALAYTFSDSFWFSAVEGEVYAMSSFFTAVTFWAILKWEVVADKPHHLRWLVLIAFMVGLAIGVHLLNLLVIPAIVFVVYYKKFKPSKKGFWFSLGLSVLLLAVILWGVIPWTAKLAGAFELFFVNYLHIPFNVGSIFFLILLTAALVYGLWYAYKKQRAVLHTSLLCLAFLLIGYSTFLILVIRANANTPLNQGEVKNAISLLSYLNRDQYGSVPFVYGQYYNAKLIGVEPANPQYVRDDSTKRYESAGYSSQKLTYDPAFCGPFPRIHSNMESGGRPCVTYNKIWSGNDGVHRPTFGQNIRFLWRYQMGWMYWRYFMWNFVGRQNDNMGRCYNADGTRDVLNGNWISGIKFIDEMRLGPQDDMPRHLAENPARNTFYFLPLILGLIGLFFQYRYARKDTFVVFLLFFMTGLAIILYLNQPSTEPRERDYASVGSFYAFAIWIGLGVAGIGQALHRMLAEKSKTIRGITYALIGVVCLLAVPGIMAQQGWDDHDRSHRTAARDFGRNMMLSCPPNAVLVSDGDNDTYPMWYCQHVEKIRPDVRLINSILANSSWLIQPFYSKVYESEPLRLTLDIKNYGGGKNESVYIDNRIPQAEDLVQLLKFINSSNPGTKMTDQSGEQFSFFPTSSVRLNINKEKMLQGGAFTPEEVAKMPESLVWKLSGKYVSKSQLVMLDIIANNLQDRPICFVSPYGHQEYLPALAQSQMEGMVYRFVPFRNENRHALDGRGNGMNVDRTYDLLVNTFEWGEINSGKSELDPETRSWTEQARHQYATLAMALIAEQKKDSAVKALDKGIYWFPDEVFAFNRNMLIYAQAYLMCGAKEKGTDVLNRIAADYEKSLRYYMKFPPKYRRGLQSEIQEAMDVLGSVKYFADAYEVPEISERMASIFQTYNIQSE